MQNNKKILKNLIQKENLVKNAKKIRLDKFN